MASISVSVINSRRWTLKPWFKSIVFFALTAPLVPLAIASGASVSEETYLSPEAFVAGAFDSAPPNPQVIWLIENLADEATQILGHVPNNLRERYWLKNGRSVWILNEVGKERPFTVGWVIEDQQIIGTQVLIYRETRGWEVRYPFFTQQFKGAGLNSAQKLDQRIDGISGATLSVRAMRRMAELALLLDRHATQKHAAK